MVHLFIPDSKGVGCGWAPSMDKLRFLGYDDYCRERGFLSLCAKCFKYFLLPVDWGDQSPPEVATSGSPSTSGSATDDSVDTDSDKEQVVLS